MAAHVWCPARGRQIEQVRLVELGLDLARDALGLHRGEAGGVEVFENDDELVAAHARHRVAFTDAAFQATGGVHQQLVADIVAERVVERLEIVEVDQHQRPVPVMAGAAGQGAPQPVEHQAPVGQAGQGVVERQLADFFLGGLAEGHVVEHPDMTLHLARVSDDGCHGDFDREHLAVLAPVPDLSLPVMLLFQAAHDGLVGVLAVDDRLDERGVLAQRFFPGIAGDQLESTVDGDDGVFGVGDHHGVGGVFEDGRGQAQLIGGEAFLGDVFKDPDAALLRPARVERATAQQGPESRPVATLELQFFFESAVLGGDRLVRPDADFDELFLGNVEDARALTRHLAGAVAKNQFGMPVGQLDDTLAREDDADLDVVEDGLLFGERFLETSAHAVELPGEAADFVGLAPVDRVLQVALGQLVGKVHQASQRAQHAFAQGNDDQRERGGEHADEQQVVGAPVLLEFALAQAVVDLQFDAADFDVAGDDRLFRAARGAGAALGAFDLQDELVRRIADRQPHDARVEQGRFGDRAGAARVDIPHRIGEARDQQRQLVLEMPFHFLVDLRLAQAGQRQAADHRRQKQAGAQSDHDAKAQTAGVSTGCERMEAFQERSDEWHEDQAPCGQRASLGGRTISHGRWRYQYE